MKKTIITTAAAALMFATSSLNAASLIIDVPFAFTAGEKTLPAGKYAVDLNNNNGIVFVRSMTSGKGYFSFSAPAKSDVPVANASVIFDCKDKTVCSLTEVRPLGIAPKTVKSTVKPTPAVVDLRASN